MKLLTLLGVAAIECAAAKSWNGDNYSEDTFCLFGWIGYLKRISLIVLMLSGVVLYYVPESRPYARRGCYIMIDFAANGLKSVLSGNDSEYTYGKIRSKYHRARYEQSFSTARHLPRDVYESNEDYENDRKTRISKTKNLTGDDGSLREQERKRNSKRRKEEKRDYRRHSRQSLRSSIMKNTSEPSMEIVRPYFYSGNIDDLQKYLKPSIYDMKRMNGASVENYALLISGSPRQMSMIDEKYEKDNVVILQDPYKLEYKECGTSTEKLLKVEDLSCSEQEGPTRDCNDYDKNIGGKVYSYKEKSRPLSKTSPRSEYETVYESSQYQCGGECCGNKCSQSLVDFNDNEEDVDPVNPTAKIGKNSNFTARKKKECIDDNLYNDYKNYNHGELLTRAHVARSERKVNFQHESEREGMSTKKIENDIEVVRSYENVSRNVCKIRARDMEPKRGLCCNDNFDLTDREGEADDENSQHGKRGPVKHDVDERPQRESRLFLRNSNDSLLFDYNYDYEEFYSKPPMSDRLKPALLKAVNWIFGGCPEAARKSEGKRAEVGKEEIQEVTDEWLL